MSDWKSCIKDLKGREVITYKGDRAVIRSFDVKCNQLGHFIGKYKVSFPDSPAFVGWYARDELTFKEQ
tara:strand:+ start:467 stop:670 length:204 start_codon:yes stop_codon:yes gene_type:complete